MSFSNETQSVASPTPELLGPDSIRAALATIPTTPGVYRMINARGEVIYVGKAKNLKNRVSNYVSINQLATRTMQMVSKVARVEVVTTANEAEALLVEASMIKRFKPHYNILLKDDKSFPYIAITNHAFPRIVKHRGARQKGDEYFGPFASVGAVNRTLELLQKIFLLRPCTDAIFKNRSRPCLQYQIKRCSAPCVDYVTPEQYEAQLARARDFLRGKHRDVQEELAAEMRTASDAMEYEKAALLRDRIEALTLVQQEQRFHTSAVVDADMVAIASGGGRSIVQLFCYRGGAHYGHQTFHLRHEPGDAPAQLLANFFAQFYQSHNAPGEIYCNIAPEDSALLADALSLQAGHKIALHIPQRGEKAQLMAAATANAEQALKREEQTRSNLRTQLESVQKLFALPRLPERIEIYDNSHIGGTNALGAMVVATPEGFDKRAYRTFTVKDEETIPGDDYAMMREMFRRRFKRAGRPGDSSPRWGEDGRGALSGTTSETNAPHLTSPQRGEGRASGDVVHPSSDWQLPDLILIDGGKGQLSAVLEICAELGLTDLPLVAISKGPDRNAGREQFHLPGHSQPFQLPPDDPTLHYLQRLRDEAHRFAIGTHRKKRSKSLTASALDDIPGIGATRKRALLQHFGSRAAVEGASVAELMEVSGISKKTAQEIYDYFR